MQNLMILNGIPITPDAYEVQGYIVVRCPLMILNGIPITPDAYEVQGYIVVRCPLSRIFLPQTERTSIMLISTMTLYLCSKLNRTY